MNYSYWETEHLLAEIDYLIVGMGLVGLQTAIALKEKEPKAHVVVIDRHPWGLGASTRNAGFGCFANVSEILDDLKTDTPENVYQTIQKRYHGLHKLRNKFGDQAIDYVAKGSCEIFTKQNRDDLSAAIDSIQAINTILHSELGLERTFTYTSNNPLPNAIGAIHNSYEGQLNTGKLYKSVYSFGQQLGIKLYGGIEVKAWEKADKVAVQTADGLTIKTNNLIICTNAFASQLLDEDIAPCRGQVIVSEPLEQLPCEGLYMYNQGYYYWRDIDNRILLGGARNMDIKGETSYEINSNDTIIAELKRFMMEEIFGKEVQTTIGIDRQWSGIMGMGKDHAKAPLVKQVEPNVYLAARLGGMGVALSATVAEDIVTLMHS
ncbi:FAD-binding oxidoreductase [Bacteroidia bacterium]|nr:FAD-binding oxidoreductase [Bacteroidia bacterium]